MWVITRIVDFRILDYRTLAKGSADFVANSH